MFKKAEDLDNQEDANAGAPGKPKAKAKGKAKKPKAEPKPKAPLVAVKAGTGHNSGIIPAALEHVDSILDIDAKIKEMGKAKRDHRNALKNDFGIMGWTLSQEISLRKIDKDLRIQRESNHTDFKTMLGYQANLDLKSTTVPRTEEEFADPGNKVHVDRISREG